MTAAERHAEVMRRLDEDDVFFCENALKIVDKGGRLVPFMLKEPQRRFVEAIEQMRAAGMPPRIIVLKARQIGFSTLTQGMIVRRVTRRPNMRALVVAHDNDTAGSLFEIGERMVTHMPPEIRPAIEQRRNALGQKFLKFGNRAKEARERGDVGLNSSIQIDTAKEASGGRGKTIHDLHLSEVAFWDYPEKLTALQNAVPDELETLIVVESTANGMNHFKTMWDQAVAGESDYYPFFSAWWEEPAYRLAFASPEAREEFVASIGTGPWGEDEPRLVEEFDCTPEQLAWRRRAIVNRCEGKLERWNAEYPASPEDAFIATGKHVFSLTFIKRTVARAERTDPQAEMGLLNVAGERLRLVGGERTQVPSSALWVPKSITGSGLGESHPFWRVWEHPVREAEQQGLAPDERKPDGQYIVTVDAASGEENTSGEGDYHAIQVIDHWTLKQVAEYRSRVDSDQLAEQALLAAYYYNTALLAVEITGHWGLPVVKDYLHRRYGYPRLYKRRSPERPDDRPRDLLGWDTNRRTKPELVAGFAELLREANDGIRSLALARELLTYVRDAKGASGAEHGHFDDLLMAWMIAQYLARAVRPRPRRRAGETGVIVTTSPRNARTGY